MRRIGELPPPWTHVRNQRQDVAARNPVSTERRGPGRAGTHEMAGSAAPMTVYDGSGSGNTSPPSCVTATGHRPTSVIRPWG